MNNQKQNQIPLFDALTHPTLNGNWIGDRIPSGSNSTTALKVEMEKYGVQWAFAVGMKGIGAYDEKTYASAVNAANPAFFPIAYFDFDEKVDESALQIKLTELSQKGYLGIKIHPRHSKLQLSDPRIVLVIQEARRKNMVVMLCTYFYEGGNRAHLNDLQSLAKLLSALSDPQMILLHAGTVRLLEMMELTRPYPNLLLDLSHTLCKYEGSSLDLDIQFLFRRYDQRICVGSDSPEFSLGELRRRFEYFSLANHQAGQTEKNINIAHENIFRQYPHLKTI